MVEFNTQKKNRSTKNRDKHGEPLYNLMNNALYGKTMENLRNRVGVKLVNSEKDYLKCTSKPSYMSHKIFENKFVTIRKRKVPLNLNKSVYIGMCILEFSKVLIYRFH